MKAPAFVCFLTILFLQYACTDSTKPVVQKTNTFSEGTFGYDLQFLQQFDSLVVLKTRDEKAQVIVSPKYQAKVFTSTADGAPGRSFGWINYNAFTAPIDSHMNAFGGENRFWLGPEGGPFSLFFSQGTDMTFSNWKTPAPIDTEPWTVTERNVASVRLQKEMQLKNYAGTTLQLTADRLVSILDKKTLQQVLQHSFDHSLKAVGYKTINTITNTGKLEWNQQTGAPCIWILDMFNPSPQTTIVIPYKAEGNGKVATTDYFGEIAPDRIKYKNSVLFLKADGKSRGKLGLSPARAKPLAGSYDASGNVLTITFFDVDEYGRYLNQEWTTKKPPFRGDAVNAYNDGPLEDGKQMGPFYELESVSPAAFLKPGTAQTHQHSVIHLTGNKVVLDSIARKHFGVSLVQIQTAF